MAGPGGGPARLPELLVTPRLELVVAAEPRAAELNAAIRSSHAELRPWVPWAAEIPALNDTLSFCRDARGRWQSAEGLDLLVIEKDTGEIVGGSGFPRLDWSVPKFEIGYWCRTDRTGRGYVREAAWRLAVLAFSELGAARVELFIDDTNRRSIAVAEGLGFRQEGLLRADSRSPSGALRNTRVYGATSLAELNAPQPR
jgi:RimJ/RimL family protein N-acetyltransferase